MVKESDLMKRVGRRLAIYQMSGSVMWYTRLNSGRVKTYFGSWIKMCDTGTPDWIALIRNKENNLTALFIECKSTTGRASVHQIKFYQRHNNIKDISCLIIKDIKILDYWINENSIDLVKDLKL